MMDTYKLGIALRYYFLCKCLNTYKIISRLLILLKWFDLATLSCYKCRYWSGYAFSVNMLINFMGKL